MPARAVALVYINFNTFTMLHMIILITAPGYQMAPVNPILLLYALIFFLRRATISLGRVQTSHYEYHRACALNVL